MQPLCVHKIVPFVELAPLTVAVPVWHIVALPPAEAVGNGLMVIVVLAVAVAPFPSVAVTV